MRHQRECLWHSANSRLWRKCCVLWDGKGAMPTKRGKDSLNRKWKSVSRMKHLETSFGTRFWAPGVAVHDCSPTCAGLWVPYHLRSQPHLVPSLPLGQFCLLCGFPPGIVLLPVMCCFSLFSCLIVLVVGPTPTFFFGAKRNKFKKVTTTR